MSKSNFSALNIESVSTQFQGVQELEKVSMNILNWKVHAVMGENGAGPKPTGLL